jgi:hypothetical protein
MFVKSRYDTPQIKNDQKANESEEWPDGKYKMGGFKSFNQVEQIHHQYSQLS